MTKILITPLESSGVSPYIMVGKLELEAVGDNIVCHMCGHSFPAGMITLIQHNGEMWL